MGLTQYVNGCCVQPGESITEKNVIVMDCDVSLIRTETQDESSSSAAHLARPSMQAAVEKWNRFKYSNGTIAFHFVETSVSLIRATLHGARCIRSRFSPQRWREACEAS